MGDVQARVGVFVEREVAAVWWAGVSCGYGYGRTEQKGEGEQKEVKGAGYRTQVDPPWQKEEQAEWKRSRTADQPCGRRAAG